MPKHPPGPPMTLGNSAKGRAAASAVRREDNAVDHAFVAAYLFWSADVSATIGRNDVVNRVSGNRHPLAVNFDFIMVTNHAALGRAAIPHAAAGALAVISFELRVEVPMPFIVADPVMPFLRARACTKESPERAS